MKKYFRVYKRFIENAVSYQAQYRGDTLLSLLLNFLWVGVLIFTIEIFFGHTESLAGWAKEEVYILALFWMIVDELFIIFFNQNLQAIPNEVTEGKLDLYIIKPANKLFLISTQRLHIKAIYRLLTYIGLFIFAAIHFEIDLQFLHSLATFLLLLCGIVVVYSVVLILNTLSFWFYRIDNINELWFSFDDIGRYPIDVLPRGFRVLFFTFIPIAYTGYFPALFFFQKLPWIYLIIIPLFALLLFICAVVFWNFAMKHYTSASS